MTVRARMMVAEHASTHQDGTISVLRGGISRIWARELPIPLRVALVVRLDAEIGDQGRHEFRVRLVDEDGGNAGPDLKGAFEVPPGGGEQNLVLGFVTAFNRFGTFTFFLQVDRADLDRWPLRVTRQPAGQDGVTCTGEVETIPIEIESLDEETREVLQDAELMDRIRDGEDDLRDGRLVDGDDLRNRNA